MTIQVTGRNVESGEVFQEYVREKIQTVLGKYIGSDLTGHVRIEKSRIGFRTDCQIKLRSGLLLQSHGEAGEAYSSADAALEKLEKRVRRHTRRLKDHHEGNHRAPTTFEPGNDAVDYVVEPKNEPAGPDDGRETPVIVAEQRRSLPLLSVSEAVMQLDLADEPVIVFRNGSAGAVNVVYRRRDGNIGWIDPSGS
ncbi:MAG: ribosome-associated translation inhibitor RaiA [Hyphomicrobiaceae bacterium]|nr:ribosome-associated translation inhibitor RaiA [Hyphomicrobiaceae bacterium]